MNTPKLHYDEPKLSREAVMELLASGKDKEIERALVSLVFHDADADFVLMQLFKHAKSKRSGVRGTAILCLGHAARIHRALPLNPTVEIVKMGLSDSDSYVRGQAHSAAEDIESFVPEVGRRLREA